jgi:hypothetical protein
MISNDGVRIGQRSLLPITAQITGDKKQSSRQEEPPLKPLTEPYVKLSLHTALSFNPLSMLYSSVLVVVYSFF